MAFDELPRPLENGVEHRLRKTLRERVLLAGMVAAKEQSFRGFPGSRKKNLGAVSELRHGTRDQSFIFKFKNERAPSDGAQSEVN